MKYSKYFIFIGKTRKPFQDIFSFKNLLPLTYMLLYFKKSTD